MIIVDTPSFDDTYEDYLEILRRIAVWLASSFWCAKYAEGSTRRDSIGI